MGGRPGRDIIRQKSLQPARCQRTMVAGCTTTNALRQSNSRVSTAKLTRVAGHSTGPDSPLDEHGQLTTKHEVLGANRLIRTRQQHQPPQGVFDQAQHDSSERHHGLTVPRSSVRAKRLRGRAVEAIFAEYRFSEDLARCWP